MVRAFDTLGEQTSYTDADGNVSTFAYDLLGRVTTTTDGLGTRTYTYDGGTERRGLVTSVTDSQAGTYTASYDARGTAVEQHWPNNVVVQVTPNEVGEADGITYRQDNCAGDDCTLFEETLTSSVHDQTRTQDSSLSKQNFAYDAAGRLTGVQDTVDDNCVTRRYGYDAGTNRTETMSYDPAEDGTCQTDTVATQVTRGYDKADRLSTAGYDYDVLGRTRVMPAADSAVRAAGTPSCPTTTPTWRGRSCRTIAHRCTGSTRWPTVIVHGQTRGGQRPSRRSITTALTVTRRAGPMRETARRPGRSREPRDRSVASTPGRGSPRRS